MCIRIWTLGIISPLCFAELTYSGFNDEQTSSGKGSTSNMYRKAYHSFTLSILPGFGER